MFESFHTFISGGRDLAPLSMAQLLFRSTVVALVMAGLLLAITALGYAMYQGFKLL